ncbi:MAG: Ppx/GppA family phosphatase, partial [Duodenibacillus sp.]|nr:Ppx/GppA family phosphatase [Duodenibacillus sp.]
MLFAAVDLGSNSFRMEIRRLADGRLVTQDYWKETIRLAAGFDAEGNITPEMQETALATLRRFSGYLEGIDPDNVRAIATQAMRVARNAADFLPRAREALGHPI